MAGSLVSDHIVTISGSIFAVSSVTGDIHPGTLEGFYASDTRFLSAFQVTVNGRSLSLLGSSGLDHSLASFYLSTESEQTAFPKNLSVVRDRSVTDGLHEDISVFNHSPQESDILIRIAFDADFADLFEVRRGSIKKVGEMTAETVGPTELRVTYRRESYERETRIHFSKPPVIAGCIAEFAFTLEPRTSWKVCVSVLPVVDEVPELMECIASRIGSPFVARPPRPEMSLNELIHRFGTRPLASAPTIETAHADLLQSYNQAVTDLHSLTVEVEPDQHVLAAGLPWFMAVFGRDSMISALQTKILGQELMTGTLRTLAGYQATQVDEFREAQPGKIPHEVRQGELSIFRDVPHSRYYGSVDATPLFLVLLAETYRWTGDINLLHEFLPAAESALRWIDEHGDIDKDGFVEYRTDSPHGLRNQCWKDSEDSMAFADGRLAEGPLAVAEVQAYVYRAKLDMAEIYGALGMHDRSDELDDQAAALKRRFDDHFWMPEEGYYALALDGQKRQVNSIASNIGHCLWSGILYPDRAVMVAQRLMAPDMFSGWGVRTLSTDMAHYNPVSYHNGSIWPHDNSFIAAGLAKYKLFSQAESLIAALVEAAASFPGNHMPELFAGYPRRSLSFPVPYPYANSPQAWASGALIYCIEVLLRLRPNGSDLHADTPRIARPLAIQGVRYRGTRWNF
ncbi:MAG: glycogen debranching N-terminal domain-containing protein [Dehalococcoidia bacterium]